MSSSVGSIGPVFHAHENGDQQSQSIRLPPEWSQLYRDASTRVNAPIRHGGYAQTLIDMCLYEDFEALTLVTQDGMITVDAYDRNTNQPRYHANAAVAVDCFASFLGGS